MDISRKNQEQVAGDNSTQNQVVGTQNNTYVTVNGISIPDVATFTTTVSTQVTQQALSLCTQIAYDVACKKMSEFESIWLPRVETMEKAIDNFAEPKFQFMLRDANVTAAKSTRTEDLNILSELLACHIERGSDIKIDAGINRAINIVNEVDLDTICALTMIVTILNITPVSGNLTKGLGILNNLYKKLLITDLPNNDEWIDNALIVGAINMLSGNFYKIERLMSDRLDGYICTGIKKDTDDYFTALNILHLHNYNDLLFVENELLPGYYRLDIPNLSSLDTELKPIAELYSKEHALIGQVKTRFTEMWDSYESLHKVRIWFESINAYFHINMVGKVLAQTNARRCYPSFPDLIK